MTTITSNTFSVNVVSGDFFVAKNGNDSNPGTEASPKLTIAAGIGLLSASETLIVKAGVYEETRIGQRYS